MDATETAPRRVLTTGELEQIRVILRGGSVVDWYHLNFRSMDEVHRFIRLQGGEPDNPADLDRLLHLRRSAVEYLEQEHGYQLPDEVAECPPLDLFLYASGVVVPHGPNGLNTPNGHVEQNGQNGHKNSKGRRRARFFACLVLKVMHIIHHIEARELSYHLPLPASTLASWLVKKVEKFVDFLHKEKFPLVEYQGGQKLRTSLVHKLLVKKEHHAATIHDRVRFRFITANHSDVIPLLHLMTTHLFPFNYVAPGNTVNNLVSFTKFVQADPVYREHVDEFQLEFGYEEKKRVNVNEFSGPTFKMLNFIVDVPIRVPDVMMAMASRSRLADLGRIVFVLAEVQIVDVQTADENERGENSHSSYKDRQLAIVRQRLERGLRSVKDEAE